MYLLENLRFAYYSPPNVLCLTAIARIWKGDQDPKCPWWFCTGYGAPEAKKRWWRGAPDLFVPGTVPLRISDCNVCLKSVPWVQFYFFICSFLESEFWALFIETLVISSKGGPKALFSKTEKFQLALSPFKNIDSCDPLVENWSDGSKSPIFSIF